MRIPILFLFWGFWYLIFTSRTILAPLLPLIEQAIGINHAMAGSFFLAFYIGYTSALFCAGIVSLYLGYKRTIFIGLIVMTISYAVLRFTASYYVFTAISAVLGLSAGLYAPCAIPLITASFDKKHWGKAIGFHETAAGFSIFSIPFLVVVALQGVSWPTIFFIMSVWSLVMALLLFFFSPNPRPVQKEQVKLTALLRRKEFWIVTILWIACSAASLGLYSILPLFLVNERGMTVDTANTIFGFSRIGGFLAMIFVGFVMDRFSVRKIMLILLLVTGISTLGIAVFRVQWVLIAMLFSQATAAVAFFPAGLMAISQLTDLSERSIFTGGAMGISSIAGSGTFPMLLGAVADHWNFRIGIFATGLLVIAACILFRQLRELEGAN